jgi:hypothetical protein
MRVIIDLNEILKSYLRMRLDPLLKGTIDDKSIIKGGELGGIYLIDVPDQLSLRSVHNSILNLLLLWKFKNVKEYCAYFIR